MLELWDQSHGASTREAAFELLQVKLDWYITTVDAVGALGLIKYIVPGTMQIP